MSLLAMPRRASALAMVRGISAGLLVGLAGGFSNVVVWILGAVSTLSFLDLARREESEATSTTRDWTGWLMQGGFLAILCAAAWDNRSHSWLPPPPGLVEVAGALFIAAGVLLRQRTATSLGRHFTVRVQTSVDHGLVESGPFRVLRHPSYTSLALVALGTALSLRSTLAVAATLLLWLPATLLRIAHEEAFLHRRFGESYARYAEHTWRLLPGIY
jgi:protein-S-isoprenylcysteine O-methyltransferase Ste14